MAAATSSSSSSLALSGLASGINWTNIINELAAAEAAPITQWQNQQATLNTKNEDYESIGTDLASLQNDAKTLSSASFFQTTTTTTSDSSVASVTTQPGTPLGTYLFTVSKMATAGLQNGSSVAAQPISPSSIVSGVQLNDTAFADPITAGSFTVDGASITVAATDSLQSVFDQINNATSGAVTASYNSTGDAITLTSSSPITLGSSADTSNFLEATQLYANGTGSVTSLNPLAGINITTTADDSNLSTAISDGGSGDGEFKINGVAIDFNSSTDSINDILQAINDSAAGVTASYDGPNKRFVLTNNNTGEVGMTMQDVTGNFLAATGLSSGTAQAGSNLTYSINGSNPFYSESNTIDASPLGLTGMSITAQGTGSTNITVSPDTNTIATAITNFVNDYNSVQNYINSQITVSTSTTSTTGSVGSTTTTTAVPGTLMGDMDVEGIATNLRQLIDASPLSGLVENLNDIGISSDGNDNLLTTSSLVLNTSLANNLGQVAQLFTDPTYGLATTLNSYLNTTLASTGVIKNKEQGFSNQYTALGTSITNLQTQITASETELQNEFVTMEDSINSINVEKEYLTAYFNSTATTTDAPSAAGTGSTSSSSSSSSGG